MDTKEFLESQGTDSQELKQAKKDVLDNALSVNDDILLFDEPSEQVLDFLGQSIIELCSLFGHTITKSEVSTPNHYEGSKDVIQYLNEDVFTREQFLGSMVFNIIKYTTRLGRKDDNYSELLKVFTYYVRLREGLEYYE